GSAVAERGRMAGTRKKTERTQHRHFYKLLPAEIRNGVAPSRPRPVVPARPQHAADRAARHEPEKPGRVALGEIAEPRRQPPAVVEGLEHEHPADPDERNEPGRDHDEWQHDADRPRGDREAKDARRWAPGANA